MIEITDENYEEIINEADKPIMIDFWAEWCGPCKTIGPIVDELSVEYKDDVIVAKVDVDENPDVATKYGIRNIPTILFIKEGEINDRSVGAVPKSQLDDKIRALIK